MSDQTPIPPAPTAPTAKATEAKLTKYAYKGPVSGATIPFGITAEGTLDVRDVHFYPGRDVELPADDDHVKALIERGYLKPAAPDSKAETKKGGKA